MVPDGMNKAWGSFTEKIRIIEKRKFPGLAIRGYCGPRNLGCCWEWPVNRTGGGKGGSGVSY